MSLPVPAMPSGYVVVDEDKWRTHLRRFPVLDTAFLAKRFPITSGIQLAEWGIARRSQLTSVRRYLHEAMFAEVLMEDSA